MRHPCKDAWHWTNKEWSQADMYSRQSEAVRGTHINCMIGGQVKFKGASLLRSLLLIIRPRILPYLELIPTVIIIQTLFSLHYISRLPLLPCQVEATLYNH
jgi:hypothetical protein